MLFVNNVQNHSAHGAQNITGRRPTLTISSYRRPKHISRGRSVLRGGESESACPLSSTGRRGAARCLLQRQRGPCNQHSFFEACQSGQSTLNVSGHMVHIIRDQQFKVHLVNLQAGCVPVVSCKGKQDPAISIPPCFLQIMLTHT